ncbi:DUF1737 domain-containing protein [Pontibacter roseus]|uniref:DUF1737 domain-containing protein n=1 Tax=Pontibacter roseus TaxID=336989 RepID=UPI0003616023|nr:DUF1737 domain-containing protein [Pontibacter roseus]
MEFDVIKAKDLQALVNSVEAYVRNGWVLKGSVFEQGGSYTQEVERQKPAKNTNKPTNRRKSWVAWPVNNA